MSRDFARPGGPARRTAVAIVAVVAVAALCGAGAAGAPTCPACSAWPTLATTCPAGASLNNVLSTQQRLTVSSAAAFSSKDPSYLLVGPCDDPGALVIYHGLTTAGQDAFKQINVVQGNGRLHLKADTPITQAVQTLTTDTMKGAILSTFTEIPVKQLDGFPESGYLHVLVAKTGPALVRYTTRSASSGPGKFGGLSFLSNGDGTLQPGSIVVRSSGPAPDPYVGPITFTFQKGATNAAGSPPQPVYVAIAGQLPAGTYGYFAPGGTCPGARGARGAAGDLDGHLMTFRPFKKAADPDDPKPGEGGGNVPAYELFSETDGPGTTVSVCIPNAKGSSLTATRVVLSVGLKSVIPIDKSALTPSFPSAANRSNLNNSLNYDFFEFTERDDGTLFINTTQVDAVGLPFTMQTSPTDDTHTQGVGFEISRHALLDAYADAVTSGVPSAYQAAFLEMQTPYRLVSPSSCLSAGGCGALKGYLDPALTALFGAYTKEKPLALARDGVDWKGWTVTGYQPSAAFTATCEASRTTLRIPPIHVTDRDDLCSKAESLVAVNLAPGMSVSGDGVPPNTTVAAVTAGADKVLSVQLSGPLPAGCDAVKSYTFASDEKYTVLQFTGGGKTLRLFAPYFSTDKSSRAKLPTGFPNGTNGDAPLWPWWLPGSGEIAEQMVFGADGVFGDGTYQQRAGLTGGSSAECKSGAMLKDIENSVVSALNRGVATAASSWDDATKFYPHPSATGENRSNVYAGFLHGGKVNGNPVCLTNPSSGIGLAYGFAYDDQGGNDPTLAPDSPRSVTITFPRDGFFSPGKGMRFTKQPSRRPAAGAPFTFTVDGPDGAALVGQLLRLDDDGYVVTPCGAPFDLTFAQKAYQGTFPAPACDGDGTSTYVVTVASRRNASFSAGAFFTLSDPFKTTSVAARR